MRSSRATILACFVAVCHAQTWTSLGPSSIRGSNGPTGRVKAVAIDPSDASHWLLGSASGGIWTSRDAGASWNPITDAQANLNIGSITFAASDPNIIYAGTGEATWGFEAHSGAGILKSVDGGATWSLVGTSS